MEFGEWTNIRDGYPDSRLWVFVLVAGESHSLPNYFRGMHIARYGGSEAEYRWQKRSYHWLFGEVTHWMPIPPAPHDIELSLNYPIDGMMLP